MVHICSNLDYLNLNRDCDCRGGAGVGRGGEGRLCGAGVQSEERSPVSRAQGEGRLPGNEGSERR